MALSRRYTAACLLSTQQAKSPYHIARELESPMPAILHPLGAMTAFQRPQQDLGAGRLSAAIEIGGLTSPTQSPGMVAGDWVDAIPLLC
jgi:hypothetical protein